MGKIKTGTLLTLLGISALILLKSKKAEAAEISPKITSWGVPEIVPQGAVEEIPTKEISTIGISQIPQTGIRIPGGVTIPYPSLPEEPSYPYSSLAIKPLTSMVASTTYGIVSGGSVLEAGGQALSTALSPLAFANIGLAALLMEADPSIKAGASIGGLAGGLGAYILGAGPAGFFGFIGAVIGGIAMGFIDDPETRAEKAVFDIEIELAPILKARLENISNILKPEYESIWKNRYTQENFPSYRYTIEGWRGEEYFPIEKEIKILGDPDGTGRWWVQAILSTPGYYYPEEVIELSLTQPLFYGLTQSQQEQIINLYNRDPESFPQALVDIVSITSSIGAAYKKAFNEVPLYSPVLRDVIFWPSPDAQIIGV